MKSLDTLRHTTAHILAQAIMRLYPDAKLGVGPTIENGFYYDFELPESITVDHLEKIEAIMKEIVTENNPITKFILTRKEAQELMNKKKQAFKVELINDLPENEEISFYTQSEFTDLCRGPHLESTRHVPAFKLLSVSGAYWRGNEENPMLQRIYGTAFFDRKELKQYLHQIEEAKKRDHRKLGKELDLYSVQDKAGPGLIYWHPKGARVRHILESFWKDEHFKHGYDLLYSPHIGQSWLWETSGHLDFYSDGMFPSLDIDKNQYFLKPMNCPFHIMMYKSKLHSYRDLPLRWAELGTVYRYEKSGVLHGLLRVRGFTQDDAHIFCTPDQMESEIIEVIRFSNFIWKTLGFEKLTFYVSTRPEKYVGEIAQWDESEKALKDALEKEGITDYKVDEGGGAFYGPKIDIKIKDALNREWQMSTIQFDFNLPERFDMTYVGKDGLKHRPYMIHRALLGSIERFFGVLIEHYAGKFPTWLAPIHYKILTITQNDYNQEVHRQLKNTGLVGECDDRNEKLGFKIREARLELIPYMLIIGNKEVENNTVGLRKRGENNTVEMSVDDVIRVIQDDINQKCN